jgi:hypothetical protein
VGFERQGKPLNRETAPGRSKQTKTMNASLGQKLISLLVVIGASLLSGCGKQSADAPAMAAPAATAAVTNASPSPVSAPPFTTLRSRWLRPDGGYVLEIRSVDEASGNLEAGYLNPRPIHVSKAQASRDGATLKVFIELRDANYPGSTYTLTYDPTVDQLKGDYFQAALKQNFDVFFTRVKP